MSEEAYDLIYWIGEATGIKSAELLDPLILDSLRAKYAKHKETIDKLRRVKEEEGRIKQQAIRAAEQPETSPNPPRKR